MRKTWKEEQNEKDMERGIDGERHGKRNRRRET